MASSSHLSRKRSGQLKWRMLTFRWSGHSWIAQLINSDIYVLLQYIPGNIHSVHVSLCSVWYWYQNSSRKRFFSLPMEQYLITLAICVYAYADLQHSALCLYIYLFMSWSAFLKHRHGIIDIGHKGHGFRSPFVMLYIVRGNEIFYFLVYVKYEWIVYHAAKFISLSFIPYIRYHMNSTELMIEQP